MPRRKRHAEEPPRHRSQRRQLSWNSNGGASNAEVVINDEDAAEAGQEVEIVEAEITEQQAQQNANILPRNIENLDNDGPVQPKRQRLQLPNIDMDYARSIPFLNLDYYDGDDPPNGCPVLLHEFTLRPQGNEAEFEEFIQQCRQHKVSVLRMYFQDRRQYYPLPLPLICAPTILEWPVISGQTDITKDTLIALRQKTAFYLTFNGQLTTIRIWAKEILFGGVNGEGVSRICATSLRNLMPKLYPNIDDGYLITPAVMQRRRANDNPQKFFNDLKQYRENMLSMLKDDVQLDHPDIMPYLRPYQLEAVRWMLQRELEPETFANMENTLFIPVRDFRRQQKEFYYNPFGGYFVKQKPTPLASTFGGVLAEEMGLGKTVEMLTLILLNPKEKKKLALSNETNGETDLTPEDLDVNCRLEAEEAFQTKAMQEFRYTREKMDMVKRKCVFKKPEEEDDDDVKLSCFRGGSVDGVKLSCFCGRSPKEVDPSPRIQCQQCNTWQHTSCVRWVVDAEWSNGENYLCPSCRCSNSVESKTTLIVSPASISDQWYAEIRKHVKKGALSVYIYRGVQNEGFIQPHTLADYDIVIVAYETLRTELHYLEATDKHNLRNPKRWIAPPSPLAAVKWWRLCLDEAQMVENALAKAAKMCLHLDAKYKWCVTGTPIQKSVGDLYGLFLLLDVDPYSVQLFWKEALYLPYVYGLNRRLLDAVSPLVWRTSKSDVVDQLGIPEQEHVLRWVDFGPVEEHFYKRTREECLQQFHQAIGQINQRRNRPGEDVLADQTRFSQLDHQDVDTLFRPLLKLRQACCHPQLVRGGRFVNFDPAQNRLGVVTMDAVLDQMIRKTRIECEDFHRAYVAALNGLAALDSMQHKWPDAAEWYREVLRSCDYHEKKGLHNGNDDSSDQPSTSTQESESTVVRTDLLQQLHALYNLNAVIQEHRDQIPPTLRDDRLKEESNVLKEKYLAESVALLEKARGDLDKSQSTTATEMDNFSPDWYLSVLRVLSEIPQESQELVDRLQHALMEAGAKWWPRFRDVNGLQYLMTTHTDILLESRQRLSKGVNDLVAANMDRLLTESKRCRHLREENARGGCPICEVDVTFDEYESRLYNFEKAEAEGAVVQGVDNQELNLYGHLRRGTWADSDLEKTAKVVHSYVNRSNRRNLLDPAWLESGKKYVKIFDILKQEFRSLRAAWMSIRDHVAKKDELSMAVEKLRVAQPSIALHKNELMVERAAAENSLKKQLGQLTYLQNLKKRNQQSNNNGGNQENEEGNREECPICTQELGKMWIFLTVCGHSLCVVCHRTLTKGDRHGCHCPICRRHSTPGNVQEVVFKKSEDEKEKEAEATKIKVNGDYSSKIKDVVRCIMEIRGQDPTAKCLVFSNWWQVLNLLHRALRDNDLKPLILNVGGDKLRRNLTVFKTSPNCGILLLPLKNGANGLNIIEATHVLLVDPSLNPAVEQQALGRVHRIGQKKKTTVHRFLIRNTVEAKMHEAYGGDFVKVDGELLNESGDLGLLTEVHDLFKLF